MDSTRRNDNSREEIDHSKSHNNAPLKLNIESYSEPMHFSTFCRDVNNGNNENIAPSTTMYKFANVNMGNKSMHKDDRLALDTINNHRQFSFEVSAGSDEHEHDHDEDIGFEALNESEPEPSPTPIVSDLDELLDADTPNIHKMHVNNHNNHHGDGANINLNIKVPSFPCHGISIPYNFDDDDSDTPEPLDTPQTPGFECSININYDEINKIPSDHDENDDDDQSDIDYDAFLTDDIDDNTEYIPSSLPSIKNSKSWQEKTMTKIRYYRSQKIKCITPITQQMAEMKISNNYSRRRSVANITPSTHRLFKLDPDLEKIRQQYVQRQKTKESASKPPITIDHTIYEHDDDDDNNNDNDNNNDQSEEIKTNNMIINDHTNITLNRINNNKESNLKSV